MASPILAITEIAPAQANKYLTHNDAIAALEAAEEDRYVNAAVGGTDVTLTETQATRYALYKLSGMSSTRNLVFPSTISSNAAKRRFAVWNADTTYALTVKSAAAGTTFVLNPGDRGVFYQNADDITLLAQPRQFQTTAYDLGVFIAGLPVDNGVCFKFVAVRACAFPDDFAGARGHVGVNPTGTAAFDVKLNGSSIGSVSINTSGVFTFATTGGAVTMAAGDRLELIGPTPQDATLSDVAITFVGTQEA